ncbi:MmgE/PrpD family protein [Methanobacterium lacus]|uniref:MmgE/PrpD family protein n=1 Tax=Methanobacterium lacus (strain AL-21) TaxID=877455 RepID=F0T957_METLA|nr:MmgE/PrpD family protein [Methanobacterium lacus]ADZ08679.1 MmgE/PrpD family protein [Methanobacterium lacus]
MITEDLASKIAEINYDELPKEVVSQAKLCFLDFLAVAMRGSNSPSGKIVKEIFNCAKDEVIVDLDKLSVMDAAFCNGVFAHSLDLDDGHRHAQLHPGCAVIPASLAAADFHKKTGKELLEAIVAGYQVSILMGKLSNPMHRNNGFHSTGTCGTLGAAAAVCKIMELNEEKIINALGLAGTQAAGLLESDHAGTMGKHLHAGKAAHAGVIAAVLAEKGFTGAKSIIDGKQGFYMAMVSDSDISILENSWKEMDKDRYHILDIYFKQYPLCRHLHSSIDAARFIKDKMETEGSNLDDIRRIYIKTYKIAAEHDNYQPETVEDLRQSLPFAVAISLIKGAPNTENMEITDLTRSLASKTVIETDAKLDGSYPSKRPSEISVETGNGVYNCQVDLPLGEPENPLDLQDLTQKFQELNPHVNVELMNPIEQIESIYIHDFMEMLNLNIK